MVHNDYTSEVPPVVEIYSDRLTITSYGGLVQGLSVEEFFAGRSMPRNRELMRVYKDLKFVEQLGSGIHRILKVYDKSIFKMSDNFVEISFPFENDYDNESTLKTTVKTTVKIIELIKKNKKITRQELADIIGKSIDGIDYNIKKLKEEGFIERIGPDKGGYWKLLK